MTRMRAIDKWRCRDRVGLNLNRLSVELQTTAGLRIEGERETERETDREKERERERVRERERETERENTLNTLNTFLLDNHFRPRPTLPAGP